MSGSAVYLAEITSADWSLMLDATAGGVVGAIGSAADTAPGWATANTFGVQFSDGTVT